MRRHGKSGDNFIDDRLPPPKPTIIICYNLNKKKYFSVIEPADITLGLEEEEELSCPR